PEPGASFHHRVGFGPLQVADRTTVVEIAPPRVLELLVRARPLVEATVRFEVLGPPEGRSCLLRMVEQPNGPWRAVGAALVPLLQARNDRSLERLAGAIEASTRTG